MKTKLAILLLVACSAAAVAEKWTFSVLADHRSGDWSITNLHYVLTEMRDMTVNASPAFNRPEFAVVCGDIELRSGAWAKWTDGQYQAPTYFPVMGDHDYGYESYLRSPVLAAAKNYTLQSDLNYHVDWKNIRLIVLDQMTDLHKSGNSMAWMESLINGASSADHVFIAFHRPAFARHRHAGPNMPAEFWDMIMKYKNKVKAVFVGHTHYYYRMRVANPRSSCATGTTCLPNDAGGIYQVDAGNCGSGYGDGNNTIVYVQVDGASLSFMVVANKFEWNPTGDPWKIIDSWKIDGGATPAAARTTRTRHDKMQLEPAITPGRMTIRLASPALAGTELVIHSLSGRCVHRQQIAAGQRTVEWRPGESHSGLHLLSLRRQEEILGTTVAVVR